MLVIKEQAKLLPTSRIQVNLFTTVQYHTTYIIFFGVPKEAVILSLDVKKDCMSAYVHKITLFTYKALNACNIFLDKKKLSTMEGDKQTQHNHNHILIHAHTHVHTHAHAHRHTDTQTHRHTHIFIYIHTHIYIYIYIHTYIYIYTYTHTQAHFQCLLKNQTKTLLCFLKSNMNGN